MKHRELITLLQRSGWQVDRVVGSHVRLRHPQKPGTITVAGGGKTGWDVPPGTLNSILKQAGLK